MTPPAAFDSAKMQLWEHAAQGNTSSGFVVVDVDLKVRLVHNKVLEPYHFDEAFVKDGTPQESCLKYALCAETSGVGTCLS